MVKKNGDLWVNENGEHLCRPLSGENCPPFIAMGHLTMLGATMGDCEVVCAMHAQEIADLHARMRATLAGLCAPRHMPAGAFEVAHDRR